jgi:hypothetical protein
MTRAFDAGEELYVDSSTEKAFMETGGGDYISTKQLAAVGQISRS